MKCAGVGVAKFSKNTHVRCGSVRNKNLLCTECPGVPSLAAHKYSGSKYATKPELLDFKCYFESLIFQPERS